MQWQIPGGAALHGSLHVPGDKSISHRALMLNALADGQAQIDGLLEGDDCLATAEALRSMGVPITRHGPGQYHVQGVGRHGLTAPDDPLSLGNSGTSMRLFCGLLAPQRFATTLLGDRSLSRRPMARVIRPLNAMGARIEGKANRPPLTITPTDRLVPVRYGLPVASAQVKSAILLAALYADGETQVSEPAPTRDHTERMLSAMGVPIEVNAERHLISITGPAELKSLSVSVPGDPSSAMFFVVAATLAAASSVTVRRVGINPTRIGALDILRQMGARIALDNRRDVGGEPVADIVVEKAALTGIDVPPELVPLAIDEFPVLFVAAANARGTTRFSGIGELRHKESDRIAVMIRGLRAMGVTCEESEDGAVVTGGAYNGAAIDAEDDHRIAMAFAVAGLTAHSPLMLAGTETVATSFPGFVDACTSLGWTIEEVQH
ncbi:MAG: 3-phosphoshikimate 1-carboxyvinyltransferase [Pseudomonadota bacterium]